MKNACFNALDKYCGTLARTAAMLGACAALFATSPAFSAAPVLGAASSPDGKARVEILSLKRTEGETVTLRFQVTNAGNDTFSMTLGNSRLVDMVGRQNLQSRPDVLGLQRACRPAIGMLRRVRRSSGRNAEDECSVLRKAGSDHRHPARRVIKCEPGNISFSHAGLRWRPVFCFWLPAPPFANRAAHLNSAAVPWRLAPSG